ncbi:MAG: hypothetical protein ACXWV5_04115 [Flavitalea sp.]
MKIVLVTSLIFSGIFSFSNLSAQSVCSEGQASEHSMPWKNLDNLSMVAKNAISKQQYPFVKTRVDKIAEIIRRAYPKPVGLESQLKRRIDGEGEHYEYRAELSGMNAPIRYSAEAWFFSLLCDKTGKVSREGETGTQVMAHVNWLEDFMDPVDGNFDGLQLENKQKLYFMPYKVGELQGYPVYNPKLLTFDKRRQESVYDANRPEESILLVRDDRLPVRPVTRQEYLNALKRAEEKNLADAETHAKEMQDVLKQSLADYDKMKFNSEVEREKAKSGAKKDVENGLKHSASYILKHKKNIAQIDDLLRSFNAEELKKQAMVQDVSVITTKSDIAEEFKKQELKGRPVVTHDFNYFDPKLPRHAIQFIQVFFKYETLVRLIAKPKMIKEVKETLDLKAMHALLEKSVG